MARGSVKGKTSLRWGEGRIKPRPRTDRPTQYQALWQERQADGSWRERAKTFPTQDDAEDHLRTVSRAKRDGRYAAPSALTVADLIGDYLARAADRLTARTILGYRTRADAMIIPHIGAMRALALTTLDVQRWIDRLTNGPYRPATIHSAIAVLSGALGEATVLGIIDRNVAVGTRRPSVKPPVVAFWTEVEARRLIAHVKDDPIYGALYQVALATGMRPGELRALAWADVDFGAGRIVVRRTVTKDADGHEVIEARTKTHQARAVALAPQLIGVLGWHRARQRERQIAHPAWQDLGLVFDRGDGHWLYQSAWQRAHRRFCVDARVPVIRHHDLRHTSATLELDADTPLKIVSDRLGHARTEITSNLYQHVSDGLQRKAADALGKRLFGDEGDTTTSAREGTD